MTNQFKYVVTDSSDRYNYWWFQVYRKNLLDLEQHGEFTVMVVCDANSGREIVFGLPFEFLKREVLPHATLEKNDRYIFQVFKSNHEFAFNGGVKFDGEQFRVY